MYKCPKCGFDEFLSTVVVEQTWKVDSNGEWLETVEDYTATIRDVEEIDFLECAKCGFQGSLEEFKKAE